MIKQTYKKWIAACTVTGSLLLGACTSTPPSVRDVSIVPLPNSVQQDSSAFVLPKSCTIGITDSQLAPAAEYLAGILSPSTGYNVKVQEGEGTITLSLGEVEGKEGAYQLKADTKKISIKGNSYGGVIAGIESLRQLFPPQIESKQIVDGVDWAIPSVEINDAPRFTWRGIMLDVSRHFYSKDEVKSAFRKKARTLHPDVNKAPDAEEKFKELGKAYETLIDDNKRATYDRYGEDGLKNAGFNTGGPFDGGFGDLNDILNSFMGGMGGFGFGFNSRRDPNAPQPGDDLRLDIELTFEEAVFGLKKNIKFDHLEVCPECGGTGAEKGSKPETCPTCHGTGQVQQVMRTPLGAFSQISTCPDCHGSGQKISKPCKNCKGAGKIEKEKSIDIKIPAGVDNMSKIRVAGEGDAGSNGGPAGDLFVVIHVKSSDYFKRDGIHVFTKLEITPAQAVLGDEVTIKTLDGETTIKIPAGCQNGNTVKIKGAGVPVISRPSQRGDHIVVVSVVIPTTISEEEKNLYKKLYELNTGKKAQGNILEKVKGVFH